MRRMIHLLSGAIVSGAMLGALAIVPRAVPAADELKVGDEAPDFTVPGSDGKTYTLSQLKGQHVVLAWFPKAFTGG